ncbi:MAG: hypothetical protein M0D55_16570 [Elusimicrobiota bacterium]|nr:MAG: hypothetical protein M0D55_16570 [Elusimicrobiota bacterium]
MPRVLLALALFLAAAAPARAWEAKAKNVDARLKAHPHPMSAPQARKPGWARKIKDPAAKVHWTERWKGRDYVFGVGLVRGVENSALRVAAAEDRARASLADALAAPVETREGAAPIPEKRVEGILLGSRILDWYADADGAMYALAVVLP